MRDATKIETGSEAEERARLFLEQHGLVTVRKNFRCKLGEIDLIMNDRGTLVFIEVRYRNSNQYGGARESITVAKRRKVEKAAYVYLQGFSKCPPCRFDVVLLEGLDAEPEWIQGAW